MSRTGRGSSGARKQQHTSSWMGRAQLAAIPVSSWMGDVGGRATLSLSFGDRPVPCGGFAHSQTGWGDLHVIPIGPAGHTVSVRSLAPSWCVRGRFSGLWGQPRTFLGVENDVAGRRRYFQDPSSENPRPTHCTTPHSVDAGGEGVRPRLTSGPLVNSFRNWNCLRGILAERKEKQNLYTTRSRSVRWRLFSP